MLGILNHGLARQAQVLASRLEPGYALDSIHWAANETDSGAASAEYHCHDNRRI